MSFFSFTIICLTAPSVLLKDLPFEIVQKIVQLMYFREVTVHQDLTIEMNNALKFLKIDDTNIAAADSDQFKVPNGEI